MPESVIAESFRQILLKIGNASWWTFSLRNFAHENQYCPKRFGQK